MRTAWAAVSFVRRNQAIALSYLGTAGLLVVMSLLRPGFGLGSEQGIRSLALEAAVIGVVSLGQTLVILSGGIDLSLPWTLTVTAIVVTQLAAADGSSLPIAVIVALIVPSIIGLANGLLIAGLGIPPVVATLGMNAVLMGGAAGFLQGLHGQAPEALVSFVRDRTAGLPNLVWLFLFLVVALSILLSWTSFGRRLYALGSSRSVALFSGVSPGSMTVATYVLAAVLNGVAGILLAGKTGFAFLGMGDPYLFTSAAAVALGGASLLGGTGHVVGTVAGALLLTVLSASIPVLRLPRAFDLVAFGVVILLAMAPSGAHVSRAPFLAAWRQGSARRPHFTWRRRT